MKKILVFVNSDWFFLLHILPVIIALKNEGNEIYILTKNSGKKQQIENYGFHFVDLLFLDRKGYNPFRELKTIIHVYKIYRRIKPDIVHQITIKPIIYGSLISRFLNIKTVNTICGLGYSFGSKNTLISFLAYEGYKVALKNKFCYNFFENKNDLNFFVERHIITNTDGNTFLNGMGANLEKYRPISNSNPKEKKIIITIACRMIWEKGVKEFVEASKILYNKYEDLIEFRIYGRIDPGNPSSISENYLNNIEIKNYIKWYGFEDDMFFVFENSDIITLPSYYREGCPMVLMEACAMGIPVITTNSIGCRECVDDGVNGFMIPVKSSVELAKAIEKLILSKDLRLAMGKASRLKAESEFDQRKIVNQYLNVFNSMMLND